MNIKFEHLGYTYMPGTPMEHVALRDVNIEIDGGGFIGLIGHTGSGKSTLIQHMNGLLTPTSGKIYVDGEDVSDRKTDLKQLRFKVGLVFQYPEHQLFEETVYDDIAYGPKNMGLDGDEIKKRVTDAAELVGLPSDRLAKSPFDLSGGMKRRAAIAGIIAMKPRVLILDEPTAGLDPKGRDDLLTRLKAMREEQDITVILVSHSMEDVAKVCDRVIVMNNGTVAMDGAVGEIFSQSRKLAEMHLSVPQISLLAGKLREMGYPLPEEIYTTAQAHRAILNLLKGNEQC